MADLQPARGVLSIGSMPQLNHSVSQRTPATVGRLMILEVQRGSNANTGGVKEEDP